MSPKKAPAQPLQGLDDGIWYWILAGGCLAAAVAFRLAFLRADPPWDFTWSQAIFTDGARAIDGARSKILFGQWIADARSPVVLFYPLVNLLAFVIFKVGGLGLAQANLVGVLPGLASVGLAFWWMRKLAGNLAGLFAAVGLGLSYVYIIYSRVPMVEALLILMLLAAFWLTLRARLGLFLAGLLVGLAAFMVKMHALHFVPVALVYILWGGASEEQQRPGKAALAVSFLAGLGLAVVAWVTLVYLVNPEVIGKYFRSNILISQKGEYADAGVAQIIGRRIDALIHVGSGRDGYFGSAPVLSILAYLGLGCVLSGFGGGQPAARPWERLAALWFVGLAAALSLLSYRPLRYLVLLAPSMALLATSLLSRLAGGRSLLSSQRPRWFAYAFGLWLAWGLVHLQHDIIFRILSRGRSLIGRDLTASEVWLYRFHASTWLHLLIFGGAAAGLTLAVSRRLRRGKLKFSPPTTRVLVVLALVALVGLNSAKFLGYAGSRRYTILDTAHSLKRVLGAGVLMVGDCSTTLSLETGFRTLPAYGDLIRYDEQAEFERYPITHFLLRFPTLFEYLTKHYAGFTQEAVPVRSTVLCGREATVVRYPPWPGSRDSGYVPTAYELAVALLGKGELEKAGALLEEFVKQHPDSYEGFSALAICRLRMGRTQEARAAVERALGLTSRDALSYEVFGDILASLGSSQEARTQWQKALRLDPYSRSLRGKLGYGRR